MLEQQTNNSIESSQKKEKTLIEIERLYKKARELKKTLPKKYKKQVLPQSISDEDFNKILKAMPMNKNQKFFRACFLLAYESGLRISEIKNLKPENINIVSKTIFIKEGKFSKDRVVPLPKNWRNYMLDFFPIKKHVRSLERNFKNAVIKSGVNPTYHFHSLRHSFATHCLERGMPINQVQILMGHSSVGTTNVYIRANPVDAIKNYEELF